MFSLRHNINCFFLFHKKSYVLVLWYSIFYIVYLSINFESCNTMVSIRTQGRVHFWVYLFSHKSFGDETLSTSRYSYGQCFKNYFTLIKSRLFLICLAITINQKPNTMSLRVFFTLLKVHTQTTKNIKYHLLEIYITLSLYWELVSSLHTIV